MNFYAVIIGTEILNGRREDKHFEFLKAELAKYGHELFASFIIKDDKELMKGCYRLILSDKNAVMFSFGGIGSTPDDLTREIAAEIFTSKPVQIHEEFKNDILQKFGQEAYPHRIHMADLPEGSQLLFNPVNNMSGFSLQERFFFVPGFPEMAHPMIRSAIETAFNHADAKFRYTLLAQTSENTLISIMQQIPNTIELSSLPIFNNGKASVELSLSGIDEISIQKYFELFCTELKNKKIEYKLI
ncbi:competence/damage-inducible protein A [bacterium]|nr:competence/damage-inducible protein A [bacterium]